MNIHFKKNHTKSINNLENKNIIDILTIEEIEHAKEAVKVLENIDWAKPLINRINDNGGFIQKNKALLFELRFAYCLHTMGGIAPQYEAPGLNGSSVDFRFKNKYEWNIELVSIGVSDAIKNGIRKDGLFEQLLLASNNIDARLSEEGEIIKVQEKILAKVVKNKIKPIKFFEPTSEGNIINIILIDMRGYLGMPIANKDDYMEICTGDKLIPEGCRHYWFKRDTKKYEPIRGLYEEENPLSGVQLLRDKIHFLGFICEDTYQTNEIRQKAFYVFNHHLIDSKKANEVFSHYPLKATYAIGEK